jgi:hypothetical protein
MSSGNFGEDDFDRNFAFPSTLVRAGAQNDAIVRIAEIVAETVREVVAGLHAIIREVMAMAGLRAIIREVMAMAGLRAIIREVMAGLRAIIREVMAGLHAIIREVMAGLCAIMVVVLVVALAVVLCRIGMTAC